MRFEFLRSHHQVMPAAPRLIVSSGTLEALKWLALVLMTLDHINKYLLHGSAPALFYAGRLAMPLFGFVLAYNLARPGTLAGRTYERTMKRLTIAGLLATPAFISLGGLVAGWWPLNIMFTLLASTAVLYLLERGGRTRVAAGVIFLLAGSAVEFWWPAMIFCIAVWRYCRRPTWTALLCCVLGCASLWFINRNLWALAALPTIFAAAHINLPMPRVRHVFYMYYPLHLFFLLLARGS